MSIHSTGLGDHEKPRASRSANADDIGGYSIDEFGELLGGASRGLVYKEARARRVIITKVGARSIITKKHARQYMRLIEAEAEASAS
jgi:hypothetical protein